MANYPTSLDAFTNPTSVDSLSAPSHSDQHANANDAIEALEAKVGIGTSTAGSATAGHVLVASSGGTTSWTTVGTAGINSTGATVGDVLTAGTGGTTTWSAIAPTVETVLSSGNFTSVSAVNLSNVLSSTYKYYNLKISGYVSTSAQDIFIRFRENTTDKATGYYGGRFRVSYLASTQTVGYNNASALNVNTFYTNSGISGSITATIYRPSATEGNITGLCYDADTTAALFFAGHCQTMTNFTGLSFYPTGQTMTGSYILTGIK